MFCARLFDELLPIYPDTDPLEGSSRYEAAGANGTYVGVHIVVNGLTPGLPLTFEVKGPHRAYKLFELHPAPVEVNTGADQRSEYLKNDHNDHVVRRAPFMIYDALEPIFNIVRPPFSMAAFCFRTPVEYCREKEEKEWTITLRQGDAEQSLSLTVWQYPSVVPKAGKDTYSFVNWFSFHDMCLLHNAPFGTPRFEEIFYSYLRAAVYTRQNILSISGGQIFKKDGAGDPVLDEDALSMLIRVAKKAGIEQFQGGALCSRASNQADDDEFYNSLDHAHFTTPEQINLEFRRLAFEKFDYGTDAVFAPTGELISGEKGKAQLRSALRQLYGYLKEHGLTELWIQSCLDEPNDALKETYQTISSITREEMPGIPILEPVLPTEAVAGMLDIWCPTLASYEENRDFFEDRVEKGDRLYVYSCLTPGGNYCNRLMDMERLRAVWLGWAPIRYPHVEGFLHWGANYTCGNDPLKRQAAMFSERVLEFHPKYANFLPAGDECIFYPGRDIPWTSTRSEAQRIGLEDLCLLQEIERRAPGRARAIVDTVFHGYKDYSKSVPDYRAARLSLLETALSLGI